MIDEIKSALVDNAVASEDQFVLRDSRYEGRVCAVLESLDPPAPPARPLRGSRPSGTESRYAAIVSGWVAFLDAQGWDATKSPPWSPEEAHHGIVFGRKPQEDSPIEESRAIE